MDLSTLPARERILVTAHDLFYRDGVRATGIDRIIAESAVAKLTFYRHFPSKDDLVRCFLEDRHDRWMAWFVDALGRHGAQPGMGLAPLVPALGEWFRDPQFRGCAFINSMIEVAGVLPEAVALARHHKQAMLDVIEHLLPPSSRRRTMAKAAALAVDGAIVRAQIEGAEPALASLTVLLQSLGGTRLSGRSYRQHRDRTLFAQTPRTPTKGSG